MGKVVIRQPLTKARRQQQILFWKVGTKCFCHARKTDTPFGSSSSKFSATEGNSQTHSKEVVFFRATTFPGLNTPSICVSQSTQWIAHTANNSPMDSSLPLVTTNGNGPNGVLEVRRIRLAWVGLVFCSLLMSYDRNHATSYLFCSLLFTSPILCCLISTPTRYCFVCSETL